MDVGRPSFLSYVLRKVGYKPKFDSHNIGN